MTNPEKELIPNALKLILPAAEWQTKLRTYIKCEKNGKAFEHFVSANIFVKNPLVKNKRKGKSAAKTPIKSA